MTKAELIEEVSRVSDLTKKHSEIIVDTVFKSIINALHVFRCPVAQRLSPPSVSGFARVLDAQSVPKSATSPRVALGEPWLE